MSRALRFDPKAKLIVQDATSIADLKKQLGSVGKINGPRVGAGKRTTVSNEAYVARRLILHLVQSGKLKFPISVEHRDGPDFIISHGDDLMPLEFTEMCPPEEGRRMATQGSEVVPVGDYSDAGTEKAISDFHRQMQEAIDRKRLKEYAAQPKSTLLIYPNSDASFWMKLFQRKNPIPFLKQLQIDPFQRLYIYWSDTRFFAR